MSGAAWTALGSVIVALITGLVALLTHRVSTRATAKASVVDGYASLTDQLQEERAAMQATITALREARHTRRPRRLWRWLWSSWRAR